MNRVSQFGIILLILFLGQAIQIFFSLSLPPTIISMILLFLLLLTGIIKVEWVEDASDSLLDNLGIMFVPAGVGLINELYVFEDHLIGLVVIIFISTVTVMLSTGWVAEIFIKLRNR